MKTQLPTDVTDCILAVTAALPGEPRLAAAVKGLANLLHVKVAFASEVMADKPTHARTLAMCIDGEIVADIEYELEGTPCDLVKDDDAQICLFESGVQQRFPTDEWLNQVDAQSYMALPFATANGQRVGHLAIVHDQPLEEGIGDMAVFQIFAALVGSELINRGVEQQRIELERKVLEGHRLESLGLLAGGVAHDFNNLLVGVTGNVSLALLDTPASSPIRHYLNEIELTAHRAADLAKQMLAYSGKGHFIVAETYLNDVVEEMMSLLAVSIPKNVVLRFDLAKDLPCATVDVTQIRQLVMNLVLNAAEAIGGKSGTISLSSGVVRVDEHYLSEATVGQEVKTGDYVFLEIADSGCGLTPDVKARMFDPFFTQKPHGRGLGLAAVQGIVKGHQGVLNVYSEMGKGTTFKLLLPATALQPASQEKDHGFTTLEGLTALVVDDDEMVLATGARILERLGCQVIVAEDGQRAVELYRARTNDLDFVLLDMTMPKMGGDEVFRLIRCINPDARVILMSGYNEQDATSHFTGKGLSGFVQKPFNMETLAREIGGQRDS